MPRPLSTRYGHSPWLDQFPKARVPDYPAYRGGSKRDVVVVGGGLTGCLTAYAFAAAGVNVTLLEADRIGRGVTAYGAGWISVEPDVEFASLEKTIGLRGARHAFQAWRRAALDCASLLRRLNVKCALDPRVTVTVASGAEQANRLKREHQSRRDAGLDAALLNARAATAESSVRSLAGLRTRESATLDPYRACVGVGAAAAGRGALMFERSPVKRIKFTRRFVDVLAAGGTIRASAVVIATGMPTSPLFRSLIRHFWFRTTYLVVTDQIPAKIRQTISAPETIVRDTAEPPHLVRWASDDQLLVTGAEAEMGPPRLRDRALVQRTGQLMYELSTMFPEISGIQAAYGWDASHARTDDGLPYFGPHRNFPHHLFAFGGDSRSITGSYLASRILLRQYLREPEPSDVPFEFARHGR